MRIKYGQLTLGCLLMAIASLSAPQIGRTMADDLEFPYMALVLKDGTLVRSGPAALHYATESLKQGDTVEVYRHDPGGWAAIRPTASSFSLIPAGAIELLDDESGRVIENGTHSWVGTRNGAVESPLWQVKLRKDEIVDILGEVSWPDPNGHSTIWYQILPPDGEYRWVKISNLQVPKSNVIELSEADKAELARHQPPAAVRPSDAPSDSSSPIETPSSKKSPSGDLDIQNSAWTESSSSAAPPKVEQAAFQQPYPNPAKESANEGWRPATHKTERFASNVTHGHFTENVNGTAAPGQFTSPRVPNNKNLANANPNTVAPRQTKPGTNSSIITKSAPDLPELKDFPSGPMGNQLKQLDVRLSEEMLKPPLKWKLEELKIRAQRLRTQSVSETERRYADRVLQKLAGCERLRDQYREAYNVGPGANTILGSLSSSKPVGSGIDSNIEFGTTYDAHGLLKELKGGDPNKPRYVLTDERGKITHYISPAPGLNLRRYVKTNVGIIGRRGFHQGYQLNHVTAERIIELNKIR